MNGDGFSLINTEEYLNAKGVFKVPFGVTDEGKTIVADLKYIPHLLVCGQIGSGKTSFVQTIMSLMIAQYSPLDIKYMVIDSKMFEYGVFNNTWHFIMPVITEKAKAVTAIKWLAQEIKRRLSTMAEAGCMDRDMYNRLHADNGKMYELFVVIDDYMMLSLDAESRKDLLEIVINGRVSGIHLIIVTSMTNRQYYDFVSCIPQAICFKVRSKAESMSILEAGGAELLKAPGEILYKDQNGIRKCCAVHSEYNSIAAVLKRRKVIDSPEKETPEANSNAVKSRYDELLDKVAMFCIEKEKASSGMIQRVFKIGFNKAAMLIDQLEELGVVGPEEGTKPRRVLMSIREWKERKRALGID